MSNQESPASALESLLTRRHSCRSFKPDPVPRERIEEVLRIAQKTASWNNVQPWQVHIFSGSALERFRDVMLSAATQAGNTSDFPWPTEYRGIYLNRRRECGFGLYAAVGIQKGDREASGKQAMENFRFFGAPHVAIITSDAALNVYGAVDCGAYVANFLLAAESLGISSIAQGALASKSAVIRQHLGLSEERRILCGISFGYEDDAHPANAYRTTRAPVDEVVRWVD
jgi:nitroreductase